MSISDYSTTPASNTSISGINIAEGCSPGGINNAIRQMMADIAAGAQVGLLPAGIISMWSGSVATIPAGWAICNGANGTPDLRNRFIVGAGSTYAPGATGGAESVTLTEAQIPSHNHFVDLNTNGSGDHAHQYSQASNYVPVPNQGSVTWGYVDSGPSNSVRNTGAGGNHAHNVQGNTNAAGGGQSHENRPPYYALAYIMKL